MAWAHWREDEGFCNIDELSAVGMTHLELQMKKESSKRTVQVIAVSSFFFNPESSRYLGNLLNVHAAFSLSCCDGFLYILYLLGRLSGGWLLIS